jgi:hypothetical protein
MACVTVLYDVRATAFFIVRAADQFHSKSKAKIKVTERSWR